MDDQTIGESAAPQGTGDPTPDPAPGTPPVPEAASGRSWLRWIGVALLVLAVGAGAFFLGRWVGGDDSGPDVAPTTTSTNAAPIWSGDTLAPGEEPVADVADALSPSVVQIETDVGLGSGVIYRPDGYIITATHVVSRSREVTVRLADGTRLAGEVVGADQNSDVAVIRVESDDLPAAPMGDSDQVRTGQMAIAIGSPWGLDGSVSSGVISSVGRTMTGSDGIARTMIQTDTPINPGNSGGALADRQGRVVGINDAIYTLSGGNDGVGFAIPINTAVSVADRLIAGEEIRTAFLGVTGIDPTSDTVGALLTGVVADSPAQQAGLQVGDLIVGYDGRTIESFADLAAAVRGDQPGDRITLTIQRGDDQITREVTLGERTDD